MKTLNLLFVTMLMFCACSSDTAEQSTPNSAVAAETKTAFTDLDVAQFKAKMQDRNVVILDVRTPGETAKGVIEGAVEMDIQSDDFDQKIATLDKDKTYLVYCQSGVRSVSACNIMAEKGFDDLYNLLGGFHAWRMKE